MARRGSIPCVVCVFVLIIYTSLCPKFDLNDAPWEGDRPFTHFTSTRGLNGHGKCAAPDGETCHTRFPLSDFPPEGERANDSLCEFHIKAAFPEMKVSLLMRPTLACQSSPTNISGFPDGKYGLKEGRLEIYTGKSRPSFLFLGERRKCGLIRCVSTCQFMTRRVFVTHD